MKLSFLSSVLAASGLFCAAAHAASPAPKSGTADASVERGRYLTRISGCNDCHTPGYTVTDGKVPESEWLTGDALGWQGPWGTTYATNLRLAVPALGEDGWVQYARNFRPRPPMPWFNVAAMSEDDLRAMYRYIVWLGRAGTPAPAYVPPGQPVSGPVVMFPAPPPMAGGVGAGSR